MIDDKKSNESDAQKAAIELQINQLKAELKQLERSKSSDNKHENFETNRKFELGLSVLSLVLGMVALLTSLFQILDVEKYVEYILLQINDSFSADIIYEPLKLLVVALAVQLGFGLSNRLKNLNKKVESFTSSKEGETK